MAGSAGRADGCRKTDGGESGAYRTGKIRSAGTIAGVPKSSAEQTGRDSHFSDTARIAARRDQWSDCAGDSSHRRGLRRTELEARDVCGHG